VILTALIVKCHCPHYTSEEILVLKGKAIYPRLHFHGTAEVWVKPSSASLKTLWSLTPAFVAFHHLSFRQIVLSLRLKCLSPRIWSFHCFLSLRSNFSPNCAAIHNILHNSVVLVLYLSAYTLSLWLYWEVLEDKKCILLLYCIPLPGHQYHLWKWWLNWELR
jgi:hypothetical protein